MRKYSLLYWKTENIFQRGEECIWSFFYSFEEILSRPGLWLGFRLFKTFFKSSTIRFTSPMKVWYGFRYRSNFACDSRIIEACFGTKMYTKNLLKQFAIFYWYIISWPFTTILLGILPLDNFALPITSLIMFYDFFVLFWYCSRRLA